ncbi:MAG: thermonuclease family protein [Candidatus Daviesbacteria bacterium]|nr:thermonuclease family protein [Candidatus Daviesbacteria bacterium]
MRKNIKLLGFILTILIGLYTTWSGLNQTTQIQPVSEASPTPVPQVAVTQSASSSAILGIDGESAQVTKVVDGDTIEVEMEGKSYKVRYVGIDTPETVDPRRPVGCFGKEASNENKNLVAGKTVILQKDVSDTDKYNRLLRYVYLPLGEGKFLFVDDYLVREGFAKVLTYPPDVKFNTQFLEAQHEAKTNKRGLWGSCP